MKAPKVVIVMPAYNTAKTIRKTYKDIPSEFKKHVIMTDDGSTDESVKVARTLGLTVIRHNKNKGYGANQKTCYNAALKAGADIVVMLHPDYQYPSELISPMVAMLQTGHYDVILGSRILSGGALRGGMPLYKYIANRLLTFLENLLTGAKLSEYHTGFRAYTRAALKSVNYAQNSNDFVFDNQILLQLLARGNRIGEISSPCRYFPEASSINFLRSLTYGLGCLYYGLIYFLGGFSRYNSSK
jgi:glycosyltransferase involved in cell wall biosynthesis